MLDSTPFGLVFGFGEKWFALGPNLFHRTGMTSDVGLSASNSVSVEKDSFGTNISHATAAQRVVCTLLSLFLSPLSFFHNNATNLVKALSQPTHAFFPSCLASALLWIARLVVLREPMESYAIRNRKWAFTPVLAAAAAATPTDTNVLVVAIIQSTTTSSFRHQPGYHVDAKESPHVGGFNGIQWKPKQ